LTPEINLPPPAVIDNEADMFDVPPEIDTDPDPDFIGPRLPGCYFKVIPHPHSTDPTPTITPLGKSPEQCRASFTKKTQERTPWYPFQTRSDFEATEIAVKTGMNPTTTNTYLDGINRRWHSGGSRLTISNSTEMQEVLARARRFGVTVSFSFNHFERCPDLRSQ
jgi:hypothetical protein